ncbi:MAG: hypothetical protein ACJAQT_002745, partial [Akkermansiaceae bacterium]
SPEEFFGTKNRRGFFMTQPPYASKDPPTTTNPANRLTLKMLKMMK